MLRDIKNRVESLEEQTEEIDLSALEDKEKISVADIVSVIRDVQAEILRKTVTN